MKTEQDKREIAEMKRLERQIKRVYAIESRLQKDYIKLKEKLK
jgi:hypothetical protein